MMFTQGSNCNNEGYSYDDGVCQNQSKWMSNLKDSALLSTLSIPGTHDTMASGNIGIIAQTQAKTLQNQLMSGIRFLDIRLAANPNSTELLKAHHGFIYLYANFANVLDTVTNFLKANPSETILMRIKQEYTNVSDSIFASLLDKFLTDPKYASYQYIFTGNNNPVLKDIRGKFVILQNFGGIVKWMLYNSFNIQDNYNLNNIFQLYNKWVSVKAQLNSANNSFSKGGKLSFMNYLSGSGGVFPYFVASGQSAPLTNAPRLSTNLTEPIFHNSYPDFPRIGWKGTFAFIMFEGTNNLTKAYIDTNKPSYVGVIISDFPGQGLINSIINVNFK